MSIKITYEHPPGSGETGCVRTFANDYVIESSRGNIRADNVVPGDCLKTTPRRKCLVLAVESV